jgi:hypothetical protein
MNMDMSEKPWGLENEKLDVEHKSEDTAEIIWNQIEVLIGKRFWDIKPEEKAVRYIFSKKKVRTKN